MSDEEVPFAVVAQLDASYGDEHVVLASGTSVGVTLRVAGFDRDLVVETPGRGARREPSDGLTRSARAGIR